MIESFKHLSVRKGRARLTQHYQLLTHNDRPSFKGKLLKCPICFLTHRAYTFSFSSKACPRCRAVTPKQDWLLDQLRL